MAGYACSKACLGLVLRMNPTYVPKQLRIPTTVSCRHRYSRVGALSNFEQFHDQTLSTQANVSIA